MAAGAASTQARAATSITVGIHDGSINNCDNSEKWVDGAAPAVNGPAAVSPSCAGSGPA